MFYHNLRFGGVFSLLIKLIIFLVGMSIFFMRSTKPNKKIPTKNRNKKPPKFFFIIHSKILSSEIFLTWVFFSSPVWRKKWKESFNAFKFTNFMDLILRLSRHWNQLEHNFLRNIYFSSTIINQPERLPGFSFQQNLYPPKLSSFSI